MFTKESCNVVCFFGGAGVGGFRFFLFVCLFYWFGGNECK